MTQNPVSGSPGQKQRRRGSASGLLVHLKKTLPDDSSVLCASGEAGIGSLESTLERNFIQPCTPFSSKI